MQEQQAENPLSKQGNWQGQIAIGFGIGVFSGSSGDNHSHQHLAHQLSFSMHQQPIQVHSNHQLYQAHGLFIPAGVPHQLLPQQCCSIYLDTTHPLAGLLLSRLGQPDTGSPLSADLTQLIQRSMHATQCVQTTHDIQAALHRLIAELDTSAVKPTQSAKTTRQLQQVLQQLYTGALQGDIPDRQTLASQLHLSESRFSHWFAQHTGIPLRTYRKWLRLICSMQYLQQQQLTDIAYQASFADHAHFSRTCMQMFGVRPSQLQGIKQIALMTSIRSINPD